jgi:signal transduction histidine kinase
MIGERMRTIYYIIVLWLISSTVWGTNKTLEEIKTLKNPEQIAEAYSTIVSHYYNSGNIDSLRIATFAYIEWCESNDREQSKYQVWRQYIQRMTEKGMQDEAIKETERLQKDAEKHHSQYGVASSEMCIGYNHRVFGNNMNLCVEYYNRALTLFEESECYDDAFAVYLNIIQAYLGKSEYPKAITYLARLDHLVKVMNEKGNHVQPYLLMKFYQFRVIATIADKGEKAAEKYIHETDDLYLKDSSSTTKEGWFGYKILCARTVGNWDKVLLYLDSLYDYHKMIGACYPANTLFKAQCLETLGRWQEACNVYAKYAQINDSVRTAELDDKLSKYTVQFEVNKLEMDKLELNAEINHNRLVTAIAIGSLILIVLIILSYFYVKTLVMNKKLDKAYKAAEQASRMKTAFIQNISHEVRTPLNSIVGFSSIIAANSKDNPENREYVELIENNNTYLLDMMNNIIAIADMDSQGGDKKKSEYDVNVCCEECINIITSSLKPTIELEYIPTVKPLIICAAKPWMMKVLLILLGNANKFTDEGKIRLKSEEDRGKNIVRLIVEDTGIGIDEEYKEKIFDRFYKVNSFSIGVGLGLAVARQIMDMIEGDIYLDNTYKEGARFVVEWPLI